MEPGEAREEIIDPGREGEELTEDAESVSSEETPEFVDSRTDTIHFEDSVSGLAAAEGGAGSWVRPIGGANPLGEGARARLYEEYLRYDMATGERVIPPPLLPCHPVHPYQDKLESGYRTREEPSSMRGVGSWEHGGWTSLRPPHMASTPWSGAREGTLVELEGALGRLDEEQEGGRPPPPPQNDGEWPPQPPASAPYGEVPRQGINSPPAEIEGNNPFHKPDDFRQFNPSSTNARTNRTGEAGGSFGPTLGEQRPTRRPESPTRYHLGERRVVLSEDTSPGTVYENLGTRTLLTGELRSVREPPTQEEASPRAHNVHIPDYFGIMGRNERERPVWPARNPAEPGMTTPLCPTTHGPRIDHPPHLPVYSEGRLPVAYPRTMYPWTPADRTHTTNEPHPWPIYTSPGYIRHPTPVPTGGLSTFPPFRPVMPSRSQARDVPRRKDVPMPRFDGTGDLKEFLLQFDAGARWNGFSPTEMGIRLACSLYGEARGCLSVLDPSMGWEYESLKGVLISQYDPPGLAATSAVELWGRRQLEGESAVKFGSALRKLALKAYPEERIGEQVLIGLFIKGLRTPDAKRAVHMNKPSTLTEAMTFAHTYESWDPQGRPKPRGPVQTVANQGAPVLATQEPATQPREYLCWACGDPGHLKYRCPQLTEEERRAAYDQFAAIKLRRQRAAGAGGSGKTPLN